MTKRIGVAVGVLVVGGALAAVALAGSLATSQAAGARAWQVEMRDFGFSPMLVEVAVGDSLVWVNRDVVPHTAASLAGDWDTGHMRMSEQRIWIASEPGQYEYVCAYHPTMRGTVVVR